MKGGRPQHGPPEPLKKLLIRIAVTATTGLCVLVPALRGFYLLHHSGQRAADHGHEFLMVLAQELEAWAADHADRFPADLAALPLAHRDREGIGIENLWGGALRAPLFGIPRAIADVRAGRALDPWGRPWSYRLAGEGTAVRVESYGADGAVGGVGHDADLVLTMRDGETSISSLGHEPLW